MIIEAGILLILAFAQSSLFDDKPLATAITYSVLLFILGLLFGQFGIIFIIKLLISAAVAFGYFWLLWRMQDSFWWWITLILGMFLLLAI
jgi:hypothetical protein